MKRKLWRYIKRLAAAGAIAVVIVFFAFIAPHRTVPILMYHSVANYKYAPGISEALFRKQMRYLSERDYNVVSLIELAEMMRQGTDIPADTIVLTFDDGYPDFYHTAYPILKKHGLKATLFSLFNYKNEAVFKYLSWEELDRLAQDDLIDIGAHTLDHPMLPLMEPSEAQKEILISKRILQRKLKEPIVVFAYPCGALDDSVKEMVRKAGFKAAVGTCYPRGEFENNDIYVLKRVIISDISQSPLLFRFMLSGYYVPTRELILRVFNVKAPRDYYRMKKIGRTYRCQYEEPY